VTTFANLKLRCASRFRDTLNVIYTADEWGEYLNEVYSLTMTQDPGLTYMENLSAVNFAAGDALATLPADTYQVNNAWNVTDGYALRPITNRAEFLEFYQPDAPSGSLGTPEFYRLVANSIELYPAPAVATEVRLEYIARQIALVSSGDSPIFPTQFHGLLVEGALARAYADDGNPEEAARHEQQFRQQLSELVTFLQRVKAGQNFEIPDSFFS